MKTTIFITIILSLLFYNRQSIHSQQVDIQKESNKIDSICKKIDLDTNSYQKLKMAPTLFGEGDEGGYISFTCFFNKGEIVKLNESNSAAGGGAVDKEFYYQGKNLIYACYVLPNEKKEVIQYYFIDNKLIKKVVDKVNKIRSETFLKNEGDRILSDAKYYKNIIKKYQKKKNRK